MNKRLFLELAMMFSVTSAFSGGILENTNQSVNFLRNPARDATIDIDGVYSNPAGVVFMDEGWHLEFNWMMVHQDRDTWSGYSLPGYGDLFKYNANNPTTEATGYRRKFEGDVDVPIQPSLFLALNKKGWSFQFGFGFVGGGGGCEFGKGLGSFESLVALSGIQAFANAGMALKNYTMNSYLKGTSYDLGLTFAAARKLTDKLSISLGLRSIILLNSYKGYLKDISYTTTNGLTIPSDEYLLDCKQKAFGIAPIIGIDYKINEHWNIAAKYEFQTNLEAKTTADNNEKFNQLAGVSSSFEDYLDGAKSKQDLPAYLAVGVQYSPMKSLRLCGGYHRFFDTATRQYLSSEVRNTNEMNLGVEYDINKTIDISCGMQRTWYDVNDSFESDASFILNSYTLGCGVGINLSKIVKLNVAYFQTNYSNKEITEQTPLNESVSMTSSIKYRRTNRLLGLGIDIKF